MRRTTRRLGAADAQAAGQTPTAPAPEIVYVDLLEAQVGVVATRYGLTEREQQIALLFARGRSSARIAEELTLSDHTVKTHLQNIYAKAGLHSRQELLDLIQGADPHREDGGQGPIGSGPRTV